MSTTKSPNKKRKRDSSSQGTIFKLSQPTIGPVGPILVSYPALQAPPSTAFNCYARKKSKTDIKDQDILVVGETDDIEFVSNEDESSKVANGGCRYLVAVHNRRTSTLAILPDPKSPYILTRTVKALKSIPPSAAPSSLQYREAKIALGETFGTKKAKANIRAQERNRVDINAMEGVMGSVMESIDKGAVGLMTQDEAKEAADNNRLIPPFNGDVAVTDPEDVYPLHGIIPEVEWKALSISAFEQSVDEREKIALLPFKWSSWVKSHVNGTRDETGKSKKKNLKILIYISAMLAFRQALEREKKNGGVEKDKLIKRLPSIPGIIVDSFLARFTEVARDSTSHTSTSATQTNLLTHIFALCLKVDRFATDTSVLAHDLSMPVSEVNLLFRSLGCKISVLNERERARFGLPDSLAKTKMAILNAPVKFPKQRMKRRA